MLSGHTYFQGPQSLPSGKRMTMGRQRKMLAAISRSSLSKMHASVIRAAVVEYADASGLWFADQAEWAAVAGRDVKTVTAAVKAAQECGVLFSARRVYTSTGRAGTSLYLVQPHVWSDRWEDAQRDIDERLLSVGHFGSRTPQAVLGRTHLQTPQTVVGLDVRPSTAGGGAEQGRTSSSSPDVPTSGESKVVVEAEAVVRVTSEAADAAPTESTFVALKSDPSFASLARGDDRPLPWSIDVVESRSEP